MQSINLLPAAHRPRGLSTRTILILVSCFFLLGVAGILWSLQQQRLSLGQLQGQVSHFQQEKDKLVQMTSPHPDTLLYYALQKEIESVKSKRPDWIALLQDIRQTIPPQAVIDSITSTSTSTVQIAGWVDNPQEIAAELLMLQLRPRIKRAQVLEIQAKSGGARAYQFRLEIVWQGGNP